MAGIIDYKYQWVEVLIFFVGNDLISVTFQCSSGSCWHNWGWRWRPGNNCREGEDGHREESCDCYWQI